MHFSLKLVPEHFSRLYLSDKVLIVAVPERGGACKTFCPVQTHLSRLPDPLSSLLMAVGSRASRQPLREEKLFIARIGAQIQLPVRDDAQLHQQMAQTHHTASIHALSCSVCTGKWSSAVPQRSSNIAARVWAAVGLPQRVAPSAAHAH